MMYENVSGDIASVKARLPNYVHASWALKGVTTIQGVLVWNRYRGRKEPMSSRDKQWIDGLVRYAE